MAIKSFKQDKIRQLNEILDKKYWHNRNKGVSRLRKYLLRTLMSDYEKRQMFIDDKIEADIGYFAPFYNQKKKEMQNIRKKLRRNQEKFEQRAMLAQGSDDEMI